MENNSNCCKNDWHDCCCCNCANHYEDFYHCVTEPRPIPIVEGCVCSIHKGWICLINVDGNIKAHSNWSKHGMCEMHVKQ